MKTPHYSFRRLLVGSAAAAVISATSFAQTTWDGGGADGLFSNATNWVADTLPPTTGGQLVFDGSTNLNATNNTFITTLATTTGNTAFTFASGAGAFNVSGTIITNGTTNGNTVLVDQNSASNQVISADLRFAANSRDRNIRFGSGSGSLTLAGNLSLGNDIIGIGITNNAGVAGTLVLTGTNTGDGKGSQIVSGGNQLRAAFWTPQDNSRVILGSDSALGNTNTGSVTTSNAVMRGILSSRILYVSTTNGDRNLSGNSIGITGGRVEYDGVNNLTIGNVINSAGNRDLWVSGAGTLTVSSGLFLSESTTNGRNLYINVTNSGNAVVSGLVYDTFHSTNALTNASVLRKAGNGTLALNGDSSATFSGTVQVEGGTLRLGSAGALGSTNTNSFTSIRAAALDLNGLSIGEKLWTDNAAAVIANSSTNAAAVTQDIGLSSDVAFTNVGDITVPRIIATAVRTVTKAGTGTLTSSGAGFNNLTAWTINQGTVVFANTTGSGADRGVTINSGGTLRLSGTNANLINDNQAFTVNTGGTFDLNGKTETTAVVSGTGGIVLNSSGAAAVWTIGGGTNITSATYAGTIQDGTGSLTLVKTGTGTQVFTGTLAHSGNTEISNGAIEVSSTGLVSFVIGGNGTNNSITGTGTALIDGKFGFNLAAASTNVGDNWTVVAGSVSRTYGTNFIVNGFNGSGGLWTNTTNGVNYVFSQSNNVLAVQAAPVNGYSAWTSYWQGLYPGFTNTAGTADPDGDGFINNLEYGFDGNPMVGTPALLSAVKSGTNAVFTFVGRKDTNTATYSVQTTANLVSGPWTNNPSLTSSILTSTNQSGITLTNDYERREFTVPASGAQFIRVQAAILN